MMMSVHDQTRNAVGAGVVPLLAVEGLSVSFRIRRGTVAAVRDFGLRIHPGEVVALVGESGSGKSTIGQALIRLLQHGHDVDIGGRATFRTKDGDAVDLLTVPERRMRALRGNDIAMIFQEPMSSLNPIYTIGSQIGEAIRLHNPMSRRAARDETIALLAQLGLPSPEQCADSYPHQISGGMRQRAMIAMALSCEPALLIADEPTTALDVTIQAQILDLLSDLQRRLGMAILIITHDLGVIAEVADQVLVMYAGQIVESADVADLFADPQHPYTIGLLGSIPRLDVDRERLATIEGMVPSPNNQPKGCRFAPRCPFADRRCRQQPPPLRDIAPGHLVACWKAPVEVAA
jgi:peptide/nickel transport system ATP-binding protein